MDPAQFPGNTNKSKAPKTTEEKKIEKVTTGQVIQKKKSLGVRFKEVFVGGDFRNVVMYISNDVLLPAMKNLVVDATSKGIERAIYGDSGPRRRSVDTSRGIVSYNSMSSRSARQPAMLPHQPPHYASRRRQAVGDIILSSRAEAEMVVERLTDIIDKFDVVSVADLYELVGLPNSYVDNNWGWTSLAYVDVRQIREGYVIDLPNAEPL